MFEETDSGMARILSSPSPVLCVVSPNYEPRSALIVAELLALVNRYSAVHRFAVLTLQAREHRVRTLEDYKLWHLQSVNGLLESANEQVYRRQVDYPDGYSLEKLRRELDEFLTTCHQATLIVDVSPLPRLLVSGLPKLLSHYVRSGAVKTVILAYGWAASYPPLYAAEIGNLHALDRDEPLERLLQSTAGGGKTRKTHALIFLGRQGFDAKLTVDSLPPDRAVKAYYLIERDDPLHSLFVARVNTPILTDDAIAAQPFISLSTAHEEMVRWASRSPLSSDQTFIVCPFGPKPLTVSAQVAVDILRNRALDKGLDVKADLVLMRAHQYSNLYSLGLRKVSFLRLELGDFPALR